MSTSAKSVQRIRKRLDLRGARQENMTGEKFYPIYREARQRFPAMGARAMVNYARRFYEKKVPEYVLEVHHFFDSD